MTGLVLAAVAGSMFGLAGLWLKLRFLWRVYERGGADDLRVAAQALPPSRWHRVRGPGGNGGAVRS